MLDTKNQEKKYTFIDLCAGIGGGRYGLEQAGLKCVGFSEILPNSIKTYKKFYDTSEETELGDLTLLKPEDIPDCDFLIAGFPCQTFSIVGKRAGFDDERGQIIFKIADILKNKSIKYFILENVKGLVNHDKGNTLKGILNLLDSIGYNVSYKVLSSLNYGLPQARERIYFVGIRKDLVQTHYSFPVPTAAAPDIKQFLINTEDKFLFNKMDTLNKYLNNKYNQGKYNLTELLKEDYLLLDTRQSDLRLYRNYIPTLRTGRSGILYVKNGVLRNLSGQESLLLQGFSKSQYDLSKNMPNSVLLQQTGNAMSVTVIYKIAIKLLSLIQQDEE